MKLFFLTLALSLGLMAQTAPDEPEKLQPMPTLPVTNPTEFQIKDTFGFTNAVCKSALANDDVPTPEVITDCNTAFARLVKKFPEFKVNTLPGGADMTEVDALASFRVIAIEYSSVAVHNLQERVAAAQEAGDIQAAIHYQNLGNRVFVIDDILSQVTGLKIAPVEIEEEDAKPKKDVKPDEKPKA